MMTGPCPCAECVLAGCDRPVVRISSFGKIVELHGKRLARHYAAEDERKAMLRKIGEQFMAKAREAKR